MKRYSNSSNHCVLLWIRSSGPFLNSQKYCHEYNEDVWGDFCRCSWLMMVFHLLCDVRCCMQWSSQRSVSATSVFWRRCRNYCCFLLLRCVSVQTVIHLLAVVVVVVTIPSVLRGPVREVSDHSVPFWWLLCRTFTVGLCCCPVNSHGLCCRNVAVVNLQMNRTLEFQCAL